jgi:hypothetical protein
MGTETEVIEHTVVVADATVTAFGFGIPLIALTHNYWPELVRTFENASDLTKAPFNVPTTSSLYAEALKIKSQIPAPPSFKVGKLSGTFTQVVKLTPLAPTSANTHYKVTINGTAVDVVASPPQTPADVSALLITAINAITDVTATSSSPDSLLVTSDTSSVTQQFTGISANLTVLDTTAAPSTLPLADLAAIRQADGDWYALVMQTPGAAAISSAAQWAEAERVLYMADSADSAIVSAGTTDIASVLMAAAYSRTAVWYHPAQAEFLAAAVSGAMLPKLPGPATFANKGLAGVTMQAYDANTRQNLHAKHANFYVSIKGLGFTRDGTAASGRYLDVMAAIDWFDVQLEDRIIALLRNNDVVPYTTNGIELVRSQIHGQILDGITLGLIDGSQPFSATAPAIETIDPNLKAGRILPDMRYTYRLAGAIHKVRVVGVVQV